jgi:hypothetical protein
VHFCAPCAAAIAEFAGATSQVEIAWFPLGDRAPRHLSGADTRRYRAHALSLRDSLGFPRTACQQGKPAFFSGSSAAAQYAPHTVARSCAQAGTPDSHRQILAVELTRDFPLAIGGQQGLYAEQLSGVDKMPAAACGRTTAVLPHPGDGELPTIHPRIVAQNRRPESSDPLQRDVPALIARTYGAHLRHQARAV